MEEIKTVRAEEQAQAPVARFTAETALNIELHEEANRAMSGKFGTISFIVSVSLLTAFLAASVYVLLSSKNGASWMYIVVCLVAIGMLLYSRLFGQKKQLKKWEERVQAAFGTNALHLTTEFYDHVLTQSIRESGDATDCGYSSLRELRESEHLFLLKNANGKFFFVDKRTVRGGTENELRAFLQEKIGGK